MAPQHAGERKSRAGIVQGHVHAGDRCRPRAPVCLQHVTIDQNLALSERLEIDDATQRPSDEALDLMGTSRLTTPSCFPADTLGR